jgi:arylamine N-acetyltransferase
MSLLETKNTYLSLLNTMVKKPSLSYLTELCHAHLTTCPFENMSKVIQFKKNGNSPPELPALAEFLRSNQMHHTGGTCYTLNSQFAKILQVLGFQCYLIKLGNDHMAIIVTIDGDNYYVDCGAAAPFFEPVAFEKNKENVSAFGGEEVRLEADKTVPDLYHYVRKRDGIISHESWGFYANQPYSLDDFYHR